MDGWEDRPSSSSISGWVKMRIRSNERSFVPNDIDAMREKERRS